MCMRMRYKHVLLYKFWAFHKAKYLSRPFVLLAVLLDKERIN